MRPMKLLILLGMVCMYGCGGGIGANSAPPGSSRSGSVKLTITWPAKTRLIPQATASISASLLSGSNIVATQLALPPATGNTSTIAFNNVTVGALTLTATALPNSNGTGTPLASGSAPVTVVGGQTSTVSVTMASTIAKITMTESQPSLAATSTMLMTATATDASGSIVLLSADKLDWSSSETGYATVSQSGIVTGVQVGTSNITVKDTESLKSATLAVTVTPAPNPFLYDGFAYTAGSAVAGQNGGTGAWGGPWNEYGQGETPSVIASGGLSFGNLRTIGNAIMTTSDFPVGHARAFSTSPGKVGSVLFISYLMEPLDAMNVGSPSTYFGLGYGGISTGKNGDSPYYCLENYSGGDGVNSSVLAVTGQTVFIVLRITFGPANANDVVDMFVNPTPGLPLPSVPDATKSDVNTGVPKDFNVGGSIRCIFDEVRFGHTFEDVAPTN